MLFSIRRSTAVEPHYLLSVLPAVAVLQGLAVAWLRPRLLSGLALGIIVVWQSVGYAGFQTAVASDGPNTTFGMPLRYALSAANDLRTVNQKEPIFVANKDDEAGSFNYLLGEDFAVKRFDGRYTFVFPSAASWYLAEANSHAYDFLNSQYGAPRKVVNLANGKPIFGLFRVPADAATRFEAAAELHPLKADLGHAVELTSYSATSLAAGQPSPFALEWRVTNTGSNLPPELRQFGHLLDSSGVNWGTNNDFRGFPRPEWSVGDVVLSWFDLGIRADAPQGGYWLETGFYEPVSNKRLLAYDGLRQIGSSIRLGPLKVKGITQAPPPGARAVATFGGTVGLLGGSWTGQNIALTWLALGKPVQDATVFVHVLRPDGTLAAQHDGQPRDGTYPTSLWDVGELVQDVHPLGMTPGAGIRLEIGMYTQPDLSRLPATLSLNGQQLAGSSAIFTISASGDLVPTSVG